MRRNVSKSCIHSRAELDLESYFNNVAENYLISDS